MTFTTAIKAIGFSESAWRQKQFSESKVSEEIEFGPILGRAKRFVPMGVKTGFYPATKGDRGADTVVGMVVVVGAFVLFCDFKFRRSVNFASCAKLSSATFENS